jgi:hypothetical protein
MERRLRKKSHVVQAAATIVGLGERQKTMVERKRKVCTETGYFQQAIYTRKNVPTCQQDVFATGL